MSRGWRRWLVAALLIAGSIYTMSMVRADRRLLNLDEAAWIFNGYYLDMYASGEWDTKAWREFERYAPHPPAAKYAFGAMLHLIGEPMRSLEPRRFWFESDIDSFRVMEEFLQGIYRNMTYRQLISARYMAAGFTVLASLLFFLMAFRLFGVYPALAGYGILVTHPMYRVVAEIGTADSILLFLSILVMVLAMKLGSSIGGRSRYRFLWGALFAVALGISFASKLVAFAWVLPAAAFVLCASGGRRNLVRSLSFVILCVAAGMLLAYVLDPGLHGAPIQYMKERISWRIERTEIQRIFYVNVMIRGLADRLCFFLGHTLFSSRLDMVLMAPLVAMGALAPIAFAGFRRVGGVVLACGAFFGALSLYALHVAWMRYVSMALPFIVLIAACGVAALMDIAGRWRSCGARARKALLVYLLACAVLVAAVSQYLGPRYCVVPKEPDPEEFFISRIFAYSLKEPCKRPKIHRVLYDHFRRIGEDDWAEKQVKCIKDAQ